MDSIFEQPRSIPKRTPVTQNFQAPVVPEASLIFQNDPKDTRSSKSTPIQPYQQSYNAWKIQNSNKQTDNNSIVTKMETKNSDFCQNYVNYQYQYLKGPCDTSTNKSMLKKVRFEAPQIQNCAPIVRSPNFQALLKSSKDSYPKSDSKMCEKNPSIDTGQYMAPLKAHRVSQKTPDFDDSLINLCVQKNSPKSNRKNQETNYGVSKTPQNYNEQFSQQPNQNVTHKKANGQNRPFLGDSGQNKPLDIDYRQNPLHLANFPQEQTTMADFRHEGKTTFENFTAPSKPLGPNFNKSSQGNVQKPMVENLFEKSTLNSESLKKFALPSRILEQKFGNQNSFVDQNQIIEPVPPAQILKEKDSNILEKEKSEQLEAKNSTCSCNCKEKNSNKENESQSVQSPSVAELLNIVKIQNEQLQLLQNQVEQLIKLNEKSRQDNIEKAVNAIVKYNPTSKSSRDSRKMLDKSTEAELEKKVSRQKNIVIYKDEKVGTSYNEGISKKITQENIVSKDKNDKISVGIMTSFQVKYTSPFKNKKRYQKQKRREKIESSSDDYENESSVSNKVFTDTWHDKRGKIPFNSHVVGEVEDSFDEKSIDNDVSLDIGFGESLKVQEPPLSPNHTVHVDMQAYSSDSDDESSASEDPGWTFYDNILGQVNNILENTPTPTQRRSYKGSRQMPRKSTDRTMEIIKQTTLKNLKEQGLVGSSGEFANMKPSEISFAVQQILMKYMSDEELANIAQKNNGNMEIIENRRPENYPAPRGHQRLNENRRQHSKPKSRTSNPGSPKILDITTLKKQPKLL